MPKALTTKQAKASFKARGRPSLTEKEQRQLERAIELEERAERAKEAEKRRAEAAKNRAAKEKSVAESARLGSQRRTDRFGFKASQFHLGAFFGKNANGPRENMKDVLEEDEDEDMFEDGDLDDEMLLQALDQPRVPENATAMTVARVASTATPMPPPPIPRAAQKDTAMPVVPRVPSIATSMPPPPIPRAAQKASTIKTAAPPTRAGHDDLSSFWDELDSSTQIARELDMPKPFPADRPGSKSGSFNSGDFDLTEEDIDELVASKPQMSALPLAPTTNAMLPPPLPPNRIAKAGAPPRTLSTKAPLIPAGVINTGKPTASAPSDAKPQLTMRPTPVPMKLPRIPQNTITTTGPAARQADASNPLKRGSPTQPLNQPPRVQGKIQDRQMLTAQLPKPMPKIVQPVLQKQQKAIRGPFLPASSLYCSPNLGFTLSQLETYVDDDIQLTQAIPG